MAYANMGGNMPCWTDIYAIFWYYYRAWFVGKNLKHGNIYELIQCCALDFFSAKHARWWSRVLVFFQDSRIRVNDWFMEAKTRLTGYFYISCCPDRIIRLLLDWPPEFALTVYFMHLYRKIRSWCSYFNCWKDTRHTTDWTYGFTGSLPLVGLWASSKNKIEFNLCRVITSSLRL